MSKYNLSINDIKVGQKLRVRDNRTNRNYSFTADLIDKNVTVKAINLICGQPHVELLEKEGSGHLLSRFTAPKPSGKRKAA